VRCVTAIAPTPETDWHSGVRIDFRANYNVILPSDNPSMIYNIKTRLKSTLKYFKNIKKKDICLKSLKSVSKSMQ